MSVGLAQHTHENTSADSMSLPNRRHHDGVRYVAVHLHPGQLRARSRLAPVPCLTMMLISTELMDSEGVQPFSQEHDLNSKLRQMPPSLLIFGW